MRKGVHTQVRASREHFTEHGPTSEKFLQRKESNGEIGMSTKKHMSEALKQLLL